MFASMVGEEGVGGWPIAELKREALKRAHRDVAVSEKEKRESANGVRCLSLTVKVAKTRSPATFTVKS